MTIVYFVRHAHSNNTNRNEAFRELTAKGMADRGRVTDFLEDKAIDMVLSSPYKRSFDTVKHFADTHDLPITIIDDFRERAVGPWVDDFMGFAQRQWEDLDYKLDGGESLHEVQDRHINALEQVLDEHSGKRIIIGSHGTAMCAVINYYDSSFGHEDYVSNAGRMPWVVRFVFDSKAVTDITMYDMFAD